MARETDALIAYAQRLGDDSLILGQRLSEWCGHGPVLEVDLALSNIALDLFGQAILFLGYAGELEGKGRDANTMAFGRDVLDLHNCLLAEQPNGDFGQTMARQVLFSTWQELLLQRLTTSTDEKLAAIAAKAVKEVAYHARFASEWVVRLGDGTEESSRRFVDGLNWMWRFAGELFATDAVTDALVLSGIAVVPVSLRPEWEARIAPVLGEAGLEMPGTHRPILGGRDGHHSEHLGHLLSEMQFLQRAYPGTTW